MGCTSYHYTSGRWTSVKPTQKHRSLRRNGVFLLTILALGVLLIALPVAKAHTAHAKSESSAEIALRASYAAQEKILNEVPTKGLSATQLDILRIAKQQFATHAISYDATVMKYTQGTQESWCADFVSWVRNQAGVPFLSPNSGSWRIPGVGTLQAYYQQYNAYYAVGAYTPKLGDVAFYDGTTLSGDNTTHVALVLGVIGNNLLTIGGNEGTGAGTVQVRSDPLQHGYLGLSGFGDSTL